MVDIIAHCAAVFKKIKYTITRGLENMKVMRCLVKFMTVALVVVGSVWFVQGRFRVRYVSW